VYLKAVSGNGKKLGISEGEGISINIFTSFFNIYIALLNCSRRVFVKKKSLWCKNKGNNTS
jgi:hypothetical protein